MKLALAITVFCAIPLIQGVPNDYSQYLAPRDIADIPILSWFFEKNDTPEKEKNDEQQAHEEDLRELQSSVSHNKGQTNQEISPESNHQGDPSRNNIPKVQPVNEVLPGEKPEPIEDFLKEMKKEINESDEQERKYYEELLSDFKTELDQSPKPFVRVLLDKTWRLINIGSFNSPRRIRGGEETSRLIDIIHSLLQMMMQLVRFIPFFPSQGNKTSDGKSTFNNSVLPSIKTSYFGIPAHFQPHGTFIGLPKIIQNDDTNSFETNQPTNDILAIIYLMDGKDSKGQQNKNLFTGKANEEVLPLIRRMLDECNTSNLQKWQIISKLYEMFNDPNTEEKDKKEIVDIVVRISDDQSFNTVFDIIKERMDNNKRNKNIYNLFHNSREKLKELHNTYASDFETSDTQNVTQKNVDDPSLSNEKTEPTESKVRGNRAKKGKKRNRKSRNARNETVSNDSKTPIKPSQSDVNQTSTHSEPLAKIQDNSKTRQMKEPQIDKDFVVQIYYPYKDTNIQQTVKLDPSHSYFTSNDGESLIQILSNIHDKHVTDNIDVTSLLFIISDLNELYDPAQARPDTKQKFHDIIYLILRKPELSTLYEKILTDPELKENYEELFNIFTDINSSLLMKVDFLLEFYKLKDTMERRISTTGVDLKQMGELSDLTAEKDKNKNSYKVLENNLIGKISDPKNIANIVEVLTSLHKYVNDVNTSNPQKDKTEEKIIQDFINKMKTEKNRNFTS